MLEGEQQTHPAVRVHQVRDGEGPWTSQAMQPPIKGGGEKKVATENDKRLSREEESARIASRAVL